MEEQTSKDRDAFFTRPNIAKRFVGKVNELYPLWSYDNVIEPSAGSGSILAHLPEHNRIGIDIIPLHNDVEAQDFFDYEFPKGTTAVVGNPPFGRQSKLAIEFFNKSAKHADVIAFIIPRSWMKYRTQKQLAPEFELYASIILPDESFTLDDKPYTVRCCGQIWAKYPPKTDKGGGYISWNDKVSQEMLDDIDAYQQKHGCYEKPSSLF